MSVVRRDVVSIVYEQRRLAEWNYTLTCTLVCGHIEQRWNLNTHWRPRRLTCSVCSNAQVSL